MPFSAAETALDVVCQRLHQIRALCRADVLKIVAYRLYESRDQKTYRIFEHRPVAVTVRVFLQYLVFEHSFQLATEVGMKVVLKKIDIKIEIFLKKIENVFEKRLGIRQYRREVEFVEYAGYVGDNVVVYLFDNVRRIVIMQIKCAAADICEGADLLYRQFVDGNGIQELYGSSDYRSLSLSYSSVLGHKMRLLVKNSTNRVVVYRNDQISRNYPRKNHAARSDLFYNKYRLKIYSCLLFDTYLGGNMIHIVTDATTDFPKQFYEKDFTVLPMGYMLDDEDFDGETKTITAKEFYDYMRAGRKTNTRMVDEATILKYVEPLLKEGKDVLYVVFSSGLSGTYDNAVRVFKELHEKYPACKLAAVDSYNASMGEGLLVWYTLKKRAEGADFEELCKYVEDTQAHLRRRNSHRDR